MYYDVKKDIISTCIHVIMLYDLQVVWKVLLKECLALNHVFDSMRPVAFKYAL